VYEIWCFMVKLNFNLSFPSTKCQQIKFQQVDLHFSSGFCWFSLWHKVRQRSKSVLGRWDISNKSHSFRLLMVSSMKAFLISAYWWWAHRGHWVFFFFLMQCFILSQNLSRDTVCIAIFAQLWLQGKIFLDYLIHHGSQVGFFLLNCLSRYRIY
jgi:hypothetical protein